MSENKFILEPKYQKIILSEIQKNNFKTSDFTKRSFKAKGLELSEVHMCHELIHNESNLRFEFINAIPTHVSIDGNNVLTVIELNNSSYRDKFHYSYSNFCLEPEDVISDLSTSYTFDEVLEYFDKWLNVINDFYESKTIEDLWNNADDVIIPEIINNEESEYLTHIQVKAIGEYITNEEDKIKNIDINEEFKKEILAKIDELRACINSTTKKSIIKKVYDTVVTEGIKELVKAGIKEYVITESNHTVLLHLFDGVRGFLLGV